MLIIGCGYVGRRVADYQLARGRHVTALTRSPERAADFRAAGIEALVGDVTSPDSLSQLSCEDGQVLVAVGYDHRAAPTQHEVYVEGLGNVLDALQRDGRLTRLIYLSSTGVYGVGDGGWMDEQSPCEPLREGGKACLAAEQLLARHTLTATRHVVLRLAGIYGPGRIPRLADLIAGRPIAASENTWLNLIHVDDVIQVIEAAHKAPLPSSYCVSDGAPLRRHEFFALLAELANAPPPRLTPAPGDSPAAVRAIADRRITNRRMLEELQVQLSHPNSRSGLTSILEAELPRD